MELSFLKQTPLFRGIEESDLGNMLNCLQATTASYEKDQRIYPCGEPIDCIGLVLSGSVLMEKNDLWGNRSIIGCAAAGQIFGETYACIPNEPMLVEVVAAEKTEVLFCHVRRMLEVCSNSCVFHHTMIQNLLQITAQKNLELSRRILYTSPKSIRGRLMTYLSDQVQQTGSNTVTVPFNRQQLADYLEVDRSALSNELSKMQRDGLMHYEKNTFYLSKPDSYL